MSKPFAITTGQLSTNGVVKTGQGTLTYAEAVGGNISLYDGTSTGGDLISTITSSNYRDFSTPIKFNDGLYITLTAGSASVHIA